MIKQEVLESILAYQKADVIAETSDTLCVDTYKYLWNEIIKDSKDDIEILSVWHTIPDKHQKEIINSLIEVEVVNDYNNEYGSTHSLRLAKITDKPLYEGDTCLSTHGYILNVNADKEKYAETFTENEFAEAENKFKEKAKEFDKIFKVTPTEKRKMKF